MNAKLNSKHVLGRTQSRTGEGKKQEKNSSGAQPVMWSVSPDSYLLPSGNLDISKCIYSTYMGGIGEKL